MSVKLRLLASFILLVCINIQGYTQEAPTREQLLQLMYQARQAQHEGDLQKEEALYKKIINLSPRYAEPYQRLGDIYRDDSLNLKSQKKAFMLYKFYAKLGGKNAYTDNFTASMDQVQRQIALLQPHKQPNLNTVNMPVAVVNLPKTTVAAVDKTPKVVAVTKLPEVKTPVMEAPKPIIVAAPISSDFNGRWVSTIKDASGREAWILDLQREHNEVSIAIHERSAVRASTLFAPVDTMKIHGIVQDSTRLAFQFDITGAQEAEKKHKKEEDNLFSTVGSVLENTLGIDMMDMNPFSAEEKQEHPQNLLYRYTFRLNLNGDLMKGELHTIVSSVDAPDVSIVDNQQACEFVRATADYTGLNTHQLSEKELADNKKFRELFSNTRKQSEANAEAMNNLGCLYLSGIGTPYNPKKALKCFATAALSNVDAQLNLAELYLNGTGVDKDINKARNWFLSAAEKGNAEAYVFCGDSYLYDEQNDFNMDTALFYYNKAMEKGCALAFYRIACLYRDGMGVVANEGTAMNFLEKAITAGCPNAKYDAYLIQEKIGHTDTALTLLEEAAADKIIPALYRLSTCYLKGEGVARNFLKGKLLEQKALEESANPLTGHGTLETIIKDTYKQLIK